MHIKWGTVSIRDCYRTAREMGGPGPAKWIDELAWREFYYAITFHFPHALKGPMLPEYAGVSLERQRGTSASVEGGRDGLPVRGRGDAADERDGLDAQPLAAGHGLLSLQGLAD